MSEIISRDIVVIGGGPAGCAAASLLAKNGRDVVLIEKQSDAHHKVCGEFIGRQAVHYLEKLGVDLETLGAHPISEVSVSIESRLIATKLPFQAWSLSRKILDQTLMQQAQKSGADIRLGMNITSLRKSGAFWHVSDGSTRFRARSVFLATGKHDLKGWPRVENPQNSYIGFKMHFRLSSEQQRALAHSTEMYFFTHGYVGFEPVENDIANLCLLVDKDYYNQCGKKWLSFLEALKSECPALSQRLDAAVPLWEKPLAIYNIPYGYMYEGRHDTDTGLYHLGDQAAVIPSYAGDGMGIALHSAFLAAEYYINGQTATAYHAAARKDFLWPIRKARIVSTLISYRWGRRIIAGICGPGILSWVSDRLRL